MRDDHIYGGKIQILNTYLNFGGQNIYGHTEERESV